MSYTLLEQVKIRLKQYHMETVEDDNVTSTEKIVFDNTDDNPLLEQLIEQAKADVARKRTYPSGYTDEQIDADLEKYNSVIVNLAVYDRQKVGGDYQASDTENGKSRSWVDRDSLMDGIYPLVDVLF